MASSSSGRTSNIVFQNALQNHINRWNSDPRSFPSLSTPEDILDEVANYEQQHARSTGRRYTDRFTSLIKRFESIFGVIDMLVSASSQIPAQIVWGGLKFIIQIASSYSNYFGKVVDALETISQSLYFYHDYVMELYKDSDRVLQVVADAYGDILDILMAVKKVFITSKNRPRVGASVAINVVFDYGLDKVLANFDRRRIFLEGEALHMDRKKRQWADQQNELDKVLDVLQFPDSDCARKHATIQDATQLDSEPRHWFLDSDEFREWSASNPAPGLFWIHGKPGVGKTFLSSVAINTIKASHSRPAVAFFYCDYQDPDKSNPSKLLASILRQFISRFRLPLPSAIAELLVEYREKYLSTNSLEILPFADWICKIATELDIPFIVIDALDECKDRAKLFPILKRVASCSRLLITSRREADIETSFNEYFSLTIVIQQRHTRNDIRRFVENQIRDHIDRNPSFTRNHDLIDQIKQALIEKADGMFLWVGLQLKYIFDQRSDSDIRAAIGNLPRGLEDTYIRSLTRIDEHPACERLKRVLRWVVCAASPLTPLALAEAVAIDEMDDGWDQEKVVNDEYSLIKDCAHLLSTVEWQDSTCVQLNHFSVYNFLTSNPTLYGTSLPRYHVYPLSAAHHAIAKTCIKYFKMLSDDQMPWADQPRTPMIGSQFYNYVHDDWPAHIFSSGTIAPLLTEMFNAPLQIELNPHATPFSNVTALKAVNCIFQRVLSDQLNISSGIDTTWSGRFSLQHIFPNLVNIMMVNCTFRQSATSMIHTTSAGHSSGPETDPEIVTVNDCLFSLVQGTRYHIIPTSVIISDDIHSEHDSLFRNYNISIEGTTNLVNVQHSDHSVFRDCNISIKGTTNLVNVQHSNNSVFRDCNISIEGTTNLVNTHTYSLFHGCNVTINGNINQIWNDER